MAEVRLEVALAHPRTRVWRALTEARLLSEWFMPTDLAARAGAQFTLRPGTLPGFLGPVSGELTELAPPERIVMRWQGERLHTRVVWELVERGAGCTLRVVQTGFIGAPATLRRRALRDTYSRLFAEQLPGVLDRLAVAPSPASDGSVPADLPPGLPADLPPGLPADLSAGLPADLPPGLLGPVGPAFTLPRPRKAPVNVATGAWTAGRSIAGPGASARPGAVPAPRAGEPPAGTGPRRDPVRRRWRPAWPARLGSAPAWARAMVIGTVAAALAVAVLAALVYTPGSQVGGDPGTGPGAVRDGPGVALQPGGVTSRTSPTESAGAEGVPGPVSQAPDARSQEGARDTAPGRGLPEATPSPEPAPASPAPVLTAQLTTSDRLVLGLGGRAVTVTVANPGPGSADGWEVAMDVGDQDVTNVFGADYAREGPQATFSPVDAELAAGASTQFSFDLPGVLASDPSGCTIDGNPCG